MNLHEFDQLVRSISYKPGVMFAPGQIAFDSVTFQLRAQTVNADHPSMTIQLMSQEIIPAERVRRFSMEEAKHWIRARIIDFEKHECDEWLRFNGERLVNPHG